MGKLDTDILLISSDNPASNVDEIASVPIEKSTKNLNETMLRSYDKEEKIAYTHYR